MFTTLIVQPIFNFLVLIVALLPGHNFGMAIIIFTVLVRWAMLPLLKKQLRNTVAMRALQPELKRIKKAAAGNRQMETMMTMELYKERGVSPFSAIGLMLVQLPLFIALYAVIKRVVDSPEELVNFTYSFIRNLPYVQDLATNIGNFDNTLFGFVDLSRKAIEQGQGIYWPAMILVIGSTVIQWLQIRQTMPQDKEARKLRHILRDARSGTQAESTEVNAAVGRSMSFVFPIMIFFLTVGMPAALSLYWLVGGLIAYLQQAYLLKQDEYDMEKIMDAPVPKKGKKADKGKTTVTTTIIESKTKTTGPNNQTATTTSKSARKKKRR